MVKYQQQRLLTDKVDFAWKEFQLTKRRLTNNLEYLNNAQLSHIDQNTQKKDLFYKNFLQ